MSSNNEQYLNIFDYVSKSNVSVEEKVKAIIKNNPTPFMLRIFLYQNSELLTPEMCLYLVEKHPEFFNESILHQLIKSTTRNNAADKKKETMYVKRLYTAFLHCSNFNVKTALKFLRYLHFNHSPLVAECTKEDIKLIKRICQFTLSYDALVELYWIVSIRKNVFSVKTQTSNTITQSHSAKALLDAHLSEEKKKEDENYIKQLEDIYTSYVVKYITSPRFHIALKHNGARKIRRINEIYQSCNIQDKNVEDIITTAMVLMEVKD